MARKAKLVRVDALQPHLLNKVLYGPPTANSAYQDIKHSMRTGGFDERFPLLITDDNRILWGVTRWAAAKAVRLKEVPCETFVPSDPQSANAEMEREIVRGNTYRVKTQVMLAREQQKLLEIEGVLARQRMGSGNTDGGPSTAADRVGKVFGESGKTVQRRLKVLKAIDAAEAVRDTKRADKLTTLLEGKNIVKALEVIKGKPDGEKRPVKVEVPDTFNSRYTRAYSEFFEACAKAQVPGEVEQLRGLLARMAKDLEAAEGRLNA